MADVPLSIVVPVLNEAHTIVTTLLALTPLRSVGAEVIVVDGGSSDDSVRLAGEYADRIVRSERGRALQMNAGAAQASGRWFLFLHADTRLPANGLEWLQSLSQCAQGWGFFRVRLSGAQNLLRVVEGTMNWRSRFTRIATGDQALFVRRDLFNAIGGFPQLPLMEDVAISKRLRRCGKPLIWSTPAVTSSRRWEERGIVRTVVLMWSLRLLFWLGASPQLLRRLYYG